MFILFRSLLSSFSEKINANFVSVGLFLPLLIFLYKFLLWYNPLKTLFNPPFCSFTLYSFLELLIFCYLPILLLFLSISQKPDSFYCKVYKKIPFFYQYFYTLTRGEIFLCRNPLFGCFLLLASLFLYLFLVYSETFLIHLRIIVLVPYLSFRVLLFNNQSFALQNFPAFLEIKHEIEKEESKEKKVLFSLLYSITALLLYRLGTVIREDIRITEKECDRLLLKIQGQKDTVECKELVQEKLFIFQSYKEKPLFFVFF